MKEFGVLVPLVTPCFKNGIIDFKGLKNVCDHMVKAGCSGIFVSGSSGRGPWFSLEDKIKICESVRDQIGSDVMLFSGCMASGIPLMLENARAMSDAGADTAVITIPGYFNYSHNEVEKIFLDFADKSPIPVLIYDIPDFSGMKLDLNTVLKLSNHPNIIGLKDSSSDMPRFKKLTVALEDQSNTFLFQGKENLLMESIVLGAAGFVVSLLHIDPRPFIDLYIASRSGNKEKAEKLQDVIIKVMDLVVECFSIRPETSTLFHFLNNTLRIRGVCDNIILEHEGECPKWLLDKSKKAVELLNNAVN